jgi:hypothetical protein
VAAPTGIRGLDLRVILKKMYTYVVCRADMDAPPGLHLSRKLYPDSRGDVEDEPLCVDR